MIDKKQLMPYPDNFRLGPHRRTRENPFGLHNRIKIIKGTAEAIIEKSFEKLDIKEEHGWNTTHTIGYELSYIKLKKGVAFCIEGRFPNKLISKYFKNPKYISE